MNKTSKFFIGLVVVFLIAGFLGALYESVLFKGQLSCGDTMVTRFFAPACIPFMLIYGFGAIILYIIYYFLHDKMNLLLLVIFATFIMSILECVGGLASYHYNGRKTWDYKSGICKGFVSWPSVLVWFTGIAIVYTIATILWP